MGATAAVTVLCTASGLPEGGVDQIEFTMTNTSAEHVANFVNVTTAICKPTPPITTNRRDNLWCYFY